MKFINEKAAFPVKDNECIAKCMQFAEKELEEAGTDSRLAVRTQLLCEEMIAALIEHSSGKGDVRIQIRKILGDIGITISAKGEEFDLFGREGDISGELGDDEAEDLIR